MPESSDVITPDADTPEADHPDTLIERIVHEADVDATAIVAESPGAGPFRQVTQFIRRSGRRIGVTIVGGAVLAVGVALIVLPGPAFVVIPAGLAILATEYAWARRWLDKAKEKAEQAKNMATRKGNKGK